MLWLYVDFPQLQLDSVDNKPCEEQIPMIVVNGQHNAVVQVNQAAIDCGVRLGFGLGRAISLSQQMQVINYDEKLTNKLLTQITQSAYQVIADISPMPPDGLLLRLSPMFVLYDDLAGCWQRVQEWLNSLQVSYRGATAFNPQAAKLIASAQILSQIQISDDKHLINQWLSKTPINTLNTSEKIIEQLLAIGISNVGALLDLPMAQLARRFDSEFLTYITQIKGDIPLTIDFYLPQTPFFFYRDLNYELQTTVHLTPVLSKILDELSNYLRVRDKLALSIELTLKLRDKPALIVTVHSSQGEQSAAAWLTLTQLQLERVELIAPVISLEINCHDTSSKTTVSEDLLSQASHGAKRQRLSKAQLLSLLHAKLGEDNVTQLDYHSSHLPEVVNGLTVSTPHSRCEAVELSSITEQVRGGLRPSYLLDKPEPLTMAVSIFQGPERLCSHWWQKSPVTRDYYIAKNSQQQWCWVFQIPNGQWFLHGYFG